MPNDIDVLTSFLDGDKDVAAIEQKIMVATRLPRTIVRETIQRKAVDESGNQYVAAKKWLDKLEAK